MARRSGKDARGAGGTRRSFIKTTGAAAIVPAMAPLMAGPARAAAPSDWTDDPFFGEAEIDADEWRDAPQRHRFVHGGFAGTATRFSVILPEKSAYGGRFVQFLQGGLGGSEFTGQQMNAHHVAFENAAYFVESNQGHIGNDLSGLRGEEGLLSWRASAQSARFARRLAIEMYGAAPHHGYVFGGSGGGMRSIDCIEAAPAIWNGAVPFIINRNGLTSYNWSVAAWVGAVLGDKLAALADATDAGGGGAYALALTDSERRALDVLYAAGYPKGAEDQLGPNSLWILGMQLAFAQDPRFVVDFWSKPGYAGHDREPEVARLLIETTATVDRILSADEIGKLARESGDVSGAILRFAGPTPAGAVLKCDVAPERLLGASFTVTSGKAKGRRLNSTGAIGGAVTAYLDPLGFRDMAPGDTLQINNRGLISFLYVHRHEADPRYPSMRQFFKDGKPVYPMQDIDFDKLAVPSGRIDGKLILLQHTHDREAWPTSAHPYIADVRKTYGAGTRERFRVWWIENACHLPPSPSQRTLYLNYAPAYTQAVRDVIAWVEEGKAPPVDTGYSLEDDIHVVLEKGAKDRGGIQPVIEASANGAAKATAMVGEAVALEARIAVPPGAGKLVRVAWDLDGSGDFATEDATFSGTPISHAAKLSHAFSAPGTYFVTVMAWSQREGDTKNLSRRIPNLARVRVVVG